jgi:hypothetical protein
MASLVLALACYGLALVGLSLHVKGLAETARRRELEATSEHREVPGDLLAEEIEERWMLHCEVDPVQQRLRKMDMRDYARSPTPLRPHAPPKPAPGQTWIAPFHDGPTFSPKNSTCFGAAVVVLDVDASGVLYRYRAVDDAVSPSRRSDFARLFTYVSDRSWE